MGARAHGAHAADQRPVALDVEADPFPLTDVVSSSASHSPTRANARVALVTCSEVPLLEPDDQRVIAPLAASGIVASAQVWDAPAVDWSLFDLVVLRSTWDYAPRRDSFVAWAHSVSRAGGRLANPA